MLSIGLSPSIQSKRPKFLVSLLRFGGCKMAATAPEVLRASRRLSGGDILTIAAVFSEPVVLTAVQTMIRRAMMSHA
jgi:hypothetical protein